mgnify:CR=1 FL=1
MLGPDTPEPVSSKRKPPKLPSMWVSGVPPFGRPSLSVTEGGDSPSTNQRGQDARAALFGEHGHQSSLDLRSCRISRSICSSAGFTPPNRLPDPFRRRPSSRAGQEARSRGFEDALPSLESCIAIPSHPDRVLTSVARGSRRTLRQPYWPVFPPVTPESGTLSGTVPMHIRRPATA